MKPLIPIASMLVVGCASVPQMKAQDLIIEKEVHAMSRNEVIAAVKECETSGLRATMVYGKRRINNVPADIVIDVSCAPLYGR